MPTLRDSDEEKDGIRERIGQGGAELEDLPLRRPSGPLYDPPVVEEMERSEGEELLGPARRSDRSWGTLAAASVLMVAFLGTFLWYQRPSPSRSTPPPYAPPTVVQPPAEETPEPVVEEPDAPPAAEPEVIEEMPAEPEPEPEEPVIVPASPAPPRRAPLVQIAEAPETPAPERVEETPPKKVLSGPPADRMAGVLRPGPGVEMPVPLDLPRAHYPEAARGMGLTVDVHLDLLVDEQGKVIEALVREGDSSNLGFNEAAVQAALDTPFQPATRWDLPGKAWTELIIEFAEPRLEPARGR